MTDSVFFLCLFADASVEYSCVQIRLFMKSLCKLPNMSKKDYNLTKNTEIRETSEAKLLILEIRQINDPFPYSSFIFCQRLCFSVLFVVTGADVC